MWNSSLYLDKYQYARTNPYVVKAIGLMGILTTLLMAYGFWHYISLKHFYFLIFGPIVVIFIANKLMRYFMQFFYQKFDIQKHEEFVKEFWKTHKEPTVDIFLPWAGEDLQEHEEVLRGVSNLSYKNYKVYMLDDIGSKDHENLSRKCGFAYMSRPNKGIHKKSGNLQYGYDHSDGEFVFILDADFIPTADALKDLIPYIATNKEIGILQTPQYFEQTDTVHDRSKIEFGGGNIVEDFYRIIMPCRDEFKAAMCVGTSAIYRREAIMKLEGTPKVHASEDLATGLLITQYGYYVKYLPLIISMGKSPETYQGYFKQHMRWCSGNLVFIKYWPNARLNLVARLIYIINPMYYLSEALTVIFSFQFLFLLYFHADSLSIYHTLYFLPYVILSNLIIPLTKTNKNKLGTKLAALNNSYTYFYTYIRMLIKGIPAWQPTGVRTNGIQKDFLNAANMGTFISSLYIILFLFIILANPSILGNYNTYIVLGWSFYSIFWHVLFLMFIADYLRPFRLANSRTQYEKALVYAKTHIVLILFCALFGAALINAYITLTNPLAPTALAIEELKERRTESTEMVAVVKSVTTEPVALGNQDTYDSLQTYIMTAGIGDSLEDRAKLAILLYVRANNLTVTNEDIESAMLILTQNTTTAAIEPSEEIAFDRAKVEEAILSNHHTN